MEYEMENDKYAPDGYWPYSTRDKAPQRAIIGGQFVAGLAMCILIDGDADKTVEELQAISKGIHRSDIIDAKELLT